MAFMSRLLPTLLTLAVFTAAQEMPDIFKLFNEHTRKSPEKKKEASSR